MRPRALVVGILCVIAGPLASARALAGPLGPAASGSPLALSQIDDLPPADVSDGTEEAEARLVFRPAPPRGGILESIRYRPRRSYYPHERRESYGYRPQGFSQVHLGFFDPEGHPSTGILVGFRGGLAVDPHIQIGANLDWRHKGESDAIVVRQSVGPGGETITTKQDLERSSSDLIPLLAFLQVSAGDLGVIPYFGVAGGYEALFLSARNFQTGEKFDGTFDGFGWQAWGGAALPLSSNARLNAEVFVNGAELGRDVDDPSTGQTLRETVDMDGAGMRFGLAWGF